MIASDSQIFFLQTYGGVSRSLCEIASRMAKEPSVQVSITTAMHNNASLAHLPPDIVSGSKAGYPGYLAVDVGCQSVPICAHYTTASPPKRPGFYWAIANNDAKT